MPKIGIPELILILLIVLVVFGAGKLPQIGGAIGKSISEFKRAQHGDLDEEKKAEVKKAEAGNAADSAKK